MTTFIQHVVCLAYHTQYTTLCDYPGVYAASVCAVLISIVGGIADGLAGDGAGGDSDQICKFCRTRLASRLGIVEVSEKEAHQWGGLGSIP